MGLDVIACESVMVWPSRYHISHQIYMNDFHQFTLPINSELELVEKVRIVEYMWQIAYADNQISVHENHLLRKIANLLNVPHGDYIAAKMRAKPALLK